MKIDKTNWEISCKQAGPVPTTIFTFYTNEQQTYENCSAGAKEDPDKKLKESRYGRFPFKY